MIIFTKVLDNINEVTDILSDSDKSCDCVSDFFNTMMTEYEGGYVHYTYDDYVKWALNICLDNPPSPFSVNPNTYGLNLNSNYFTLKTPNGFGIGIRINNRKGSVNYEVSILFYGDQAVLESTEDYKNLSRNEWKKKEL